MDMRNVYRVVEEAPLDSRAGIRVEKLTGDEAVSVFVAEIAPGTAVKPHYHRRGIEIYQIVEGQGTMAVGSVQYHRAGWEEEFPVVKGDSFSIGEGKVHRLTNTGGAPLIALFICSPSHLGEDRFFIEG